MDNFKFKMGDVVEIIISSETGIVRGRAEYDDSANSYYVEYEAKDGRGVEKWWRERSLYKVNKI